MEADEARQGGSVPAQLDEIIDLLGQRAAHGFQEVVGLANDAPERLPDLVLAAAARLERSSTAIDAVLELVSDSALGGIADAAVDALRIGKDPSDSQAASLIAELSLQSPSTLRPHLRDLWQLHPNSDSYYAEWPWRGAEDQSDLDILFRYLGDADGETRRRAWRGLLESRTHEGWDVALDSVGSAVADDWWAEGSLYLVGVERQAEGLRQLFRPGAAHIEFPQGFLKPPQWNSVRGRLDYPTWHLDTELLGRGRFGGATDEACKVCDQSLHRLLTIESMPVGIEGPREVVTCLSCLGWSVPVLFFEHRSTTPTPAGWAVPKRAPEFPADPLPEADIVFRETPERWRLQDWALSNSRQNLNRLGGEPTWIQSPEFHRCPECSMTMTFLLQLDSLDIEAGPWWLWGSGGILYVLWCGACSITATSWQCT